MSSEVKRKRNKKGRQKESIDTKKGKADIFMAPNSNFLFSFTFNYFYVYLNTQVQLFNYILPSWPLT